LASYVSTSLSDGSLWIVLVCLVLVAGVVIGLYTRLGSGISSHPYSKVHGSGELGTDLPDESIGRAELEPLLWRRRAGNRGPHHRD
jgi:hypothetical protein